MKQWKLPEAAKVLKLLEKYKYVLIVIAAGIALLLWPTGDSRSQPDRDVVNPLQDDFDLEELEKKLSNTLSQIEGAGKVTVTLTLKSGMEQVLASDRTTTVSERGSSVEEETVLRSTGSGEEALLITRKYPMFQGALVVCEGGDNPDVKLAMTRAVASLTGLGADKITICKGNSGRPGAGG